MFSQREFKEVSSVTGGAGEEVLLDEAESGPPEIESAKPYARLRILKGLLWAEWYAHSKLVLSFLTLWLVCVWVLPIFAHPGWILLLGFIFAFIGGPLYGGGDVIEGCEEFTFSLP